MSLQELKNQAYKLSVSDRLELVKAIIYSLENELRPPYRSKRRSGADAWEERKQISHPQLMPKLRRC